MKHTVADISLKEVYNVAYPNILPFNGGKKRKAAEFFYTVLLFNAVDCLSAKKLKDINIAGFLLYYLDKAGLTLKDLHQSIKHDEYLADTDIDEYLYDSHKEDSIFDDINILGENRPDILYNHFGIDPENSLNDTFSIEDFLILDFDISMFSYFPNRLMDEASEKRFKPLENFIHSIFSIQNMEDKDISIENLYEYYLSKIDLTGLKYSNIMASVQKLLSNYTYKVDKVKDSFKSQVVKTIERKAEKDMTEEINNYTRLREINNYVIGQEKATSQIVDNILGSLVGFKSNDEPVSTFLLTGPTGVGKTETAKAVAHLMCNDNIYTVDMSTFKTREDISRLVGASPNYVGYGDPNPFTDFLKEHPDGVILFDEIDKAEYSCLDILMRSLDEAEFVDAKGKKFSLKNNIIFCTTNLSTYVTQMGFNKDDVRTEDKLSNGEGLRKELLARFNAVIEYNSLTRESYIKIAKKFMDNKVKIFLEKNNANNIKLKYDEALLEKIVDEADTTLLGARDLKKMVQRIFITPITKYIVQNQPKNITICVGVNGIEIVDEHVDEKCVTPPPTD